MDTAAQTTDHRFEGAEAIRPMTSANEAPKRQQDLSNRELFYELLVLSMANLYGKVPLGSSLFDRSAIKAVTGHMADNDAGKLVTKAEDWIRQENLVRAQEGQKSYSPSCQTLAALEAVGPDGRLGELMERAARAYVGQTPPLDVRQATRRLAASFISAMSKG
ncbi:MAG: hypothetical protein KDK89_02670 [Alphaproteobacteria bacterium]|nr:hypothetical protein [Alphaproteobacteria bacterium]